MQIRFQVIVCHQDTTLAVLFYYLMRKFMNHLNHGLMLMLDFHVLIIMAVSFFLLVLMIIKFSMIGAAKTVQRKGRGGQDFGANYKIVPMSGK